MANVLDLFAYRNISKAIESVKTGIPNALIPAFANVKEDVLGIETTFHTLYGQRKLVRRTEYAAPAPQYTQQKVGAKGVILGSFSGHVKIEQELILRLRQINDVMAQDKAREFIARAAKDHVQRFSNNRIAHQTQLLNKGIFWYDATGKLLQSSSGAVVTVDMGIPAGHLNQLGGIIAASWATTTTDIFLHVERIKRDAVQATGRPLKHAFYGLNIPGYIYKNDSFKHYFQHNPQFYSAFAMNPGSIPNGFMGLDWHPMRDTFYEQEDDTITQLWDVDTVTFTPEITEDVYTHFDGSVLVPTTIGIGTSIEEMVATTKLVHGIYGFALFEATSSLVGKLIYGDNMIPMWKNPLDIWIADVTP